MFNFEIKEQKNTIAVVNDASVKTSEPIVMNLHHQTTNFLH